MRKLTITAVAVAVMIVVGVWAASTYLPADGRRSSSSSSSTSATGTAAFEAPSVVRVLSPQGDSPGDWLVDNPSIAGSSLKIDYPPGYDVLANFTLALINAERSSQGLNQLSLSSVTSGQQHADSMAYYGYFSHWDVQGYKPYMRYTLLGGKGSVEENVALSYCSGSSVVATNAPAPCTVQTVENAINASEWEMMNNDSQCCDNGHRDNILGPFHDFVSLGIAYNSTAVFLVEDFEDSYIASESLAVSAGVVSFSGTLPQVPYTWMTRQVGAEITVFYDPTPSDINRSQLDQLTSCSQYSELNESTACQYQGAYNPGTAVSTVFEPCPAAEECATGSYTYAQTWQYNSTSGNFDIVFSMAAIEAAHGDGVYTLYLWPSERAPEAITSLSIFVTGG